MEWKMNEGMSPSSNDMLDVSQRRLLLHRDPLHNLTLLVLSSRKIGIVVVSIRNALYSLIPCLDK